MAQTPRQNRTPKRAIFAEAVRKRLPCVGLFFPRSANFREGAWGSSNLKTVCDIQQKETGRASEDARPECVESIELPGHAPHELRGARAALRRGDAETIIRRTCVRGRVDHVREVDRLRRVEDFRAEFEPRLAGQLEGLGQAEIHLPEPS